MGIRRGLISGTRWRLQAVVLSAAAALALSACTGSPSPGATPPSNTKSSEVTVKADAVSIARVGRAQVSVPAGAAPAGSVLSLETVPVPPFPVPAGLVLPASAVQVRLSSGTLGAPATLTFPAPAGADGTSLIPVVLWQDGNSAWRMLPSTFDPATGTLTAATDHFSFGLPALVDVKKWAADRKDDILNYLSGRMGAKPPKCAQESAARGDTIKVTSDGGDSVKWCFGMDGSQRVLRIVNNRRTFSDITYPKTWKVLDKQSVSISEDAIIRAVAGKTGSWSAPKGKAVRVVDGGDTLVLAVPGDQGGQVTVEMGTTAWLLSALKFGVETYVDVAKVSGESLAEASKGSWKRILARLAGLEEMDGYTEALRGCSKAITEVSDSSPAKIGPGVLKFAWGCLPELMTADLKASGIKMFAAGVVLKSVAFIVGGILTAVNLIVSGLREIWDSIASFGGKSDSVYDIKISVAAPPCPTEAWMRQAAGAVSLGKATGVSAGSVQCSGVWASAGVDIDDGSELLDGTPIGNTYPFLFHYSNGAWHVVGRDQPCTRHEVPADMWQNICNAS